MQLTLDLQARMAELYSDHHRWLRSGLQRRLRSPHDAADLTQDTFLRVFSAPQLLELHEPRTFLHCLSAAQ